MEKKRQQMRAIYTISGAITLYFLGIFLTQMYLVYWR